MASTRIRVFLGLMLAGLVAACAPSDTTEDTEVEQAAPAALLPSSKRVMPKSVAEARAEAPRRWQNITRAFTEPFIAHPNFPTPVVGGKTTKLPAQLPDYTSDQTGIRQIAAGLFAFKQGQSWAPGFQDAVDNRGNWVAAAEYYFKQQVRAFRPVGTSGSPKDKYERDYDMWLRELITLLYAFVDEPTLLTNDMVWEMICQEGEGGCNPADLSSSHATYSGTTPHKQIYLGYAVPIGEIGDFSETENHSLMINGYKYLINDYLKWAGNLPSNHPRYDARIAALYGRDPSFYENQGSALEDWVLQMLGRPLHNGMFETNAKPYEAISLQAIMNLYMGANALRDSSGGRKVKSAARNALDYLSAKFAFQSFEGKRMAPFRRNYDNRRRWGVGNNDYVVDIMAMFSGAYVFDDQFDDASIQTTSYGNQFRSRYYWYQQGNGLEVDGAMAAALWAAIFMEKTGYSIPLAIHDFMLNKHDGYYTRAFTQFTGPGATGSSSSGNVGHYGWHQDPHYFTSATSAFRDGHMNSSPEFYFTTPDYLSSAGGQGLHYYDPSIFTDSLNTYDWISRPFSVMPRGDIGRFWGLQGDDRGLMNQELLTMTGNVSYEFESKNLGLYKNFAVGYRHNDSGSDFHLTWPQYYPSAWASGKDNRGQTIATPEFGIGRAMFRIFDLRYVDAVQGTPHNYYLVMARVSKSANEGQYREYGRGFYEIVPASAAATKEDLKAKVVANNPASYYTDSTSDHFFYKLVTSGDLIQFDRKVGASVSCQPILAIWDQNGKPLDLTQEHVNFCDENSQRKLPLLEVRAVDKNYRFTGVKYAEAAGNGVVIVRNPFVGSTLTLDSSNYTTPARNEVLPSLPCPSPIAELWSQPLGSAASHAQASWGDPWVDTASRKLVLTGDDVVDLKDTYAGSYYVSTQVTLSGGTVFTPYPYTDGVLLPSIRRVDGDMQLGGDRYGAEYWSDAYPAGFAGTRIPGVLSARVTSYVKAGARKMAVKVEANGQVYRSGWTSTFTWPQTVMGKFRFVGENNSSVYWSGDDALYLGPLGGCSGLSDEDIDGAYNR